MTDEQRLAELQAALLDLLDRKVPPRALIDNLRQDLRFAEHAEYLATFEPRMVAVAQELIAKWGRRDGGNMFQETGSK
jgi:hypothetical protein